jgi:hypothetical protein
VDKMGNVWVKKCGHCFLTKAEHKRMRELKPLG